MLMAYGIYEHNYQRCRTFIHLDGSGSTHSTRENLPAVPALHKELQFIDMEYMTIT